jgi:hypothetical protein
MIFGVHFDPRVATIADFVFGSEEILLDFCSAVCDPLSLTPGIDFSPDATNIAKPEVDKAGRLVDRRPMLLTYAPAMPRKAQAAHDPTKPVLFGGICIGIIKTKENVAEQISGDTPNVECKQLYSSILTGPFSESRVK